MKTHLSSRGNIKPRIIIHGGAGNITPSTVPPSVHAAYTSALHTITLSTQNLLNDHTTTALDAATHAVSLLENNALFNAGHGAVFTRAGTNELEASVMVSNGKRKRGVGVMLVRRVKNPILLVKEMLLRGEKDDGGGGGAHCQLSGEYVEGLAREWGCDMCDPSYYFTQKRWDEHLRGLAREKRATALSAARGLRENYGEKAGAESDPMGDDGDPTWSPYEYLPQGTTGCVVLDRWGTVCVATSTGGLTNKLPGRIGDTPTLGAGFWAEEWEEEQLATPLPYIAPQIPWGPQGLQDLVSLAKQVFGNCLPMWKNSAYLPLPSSSYQESKTASETLKRKRAVAISGTGNGDSFLRLCAAHTTACLCRFSTPAMSLSSAVHAVSGPDGELQRSAGLRWGKTGEGEGGMIGIELSDEKGELVWDFNCGGMFRGYVDADGRVKVGVFRGDDR
ncbi:MAG: hypothetical protein M1819_001773 [Sarea resinae]|nr:MAG: hypothetical protein M1819_001773 [Sarea resinae]